MKLGGSHILLQESLDSAWTQSIFFKPFLEKHLDYKNNFHQMLFV